MRKKSKARFSLQLTGELAEALTVEAHRHLRSRNQLIVDFSCICLKALKTEGSGMQLKLNRMDSWRKEFKA